MAGMDGQSWRRILALVGLLAVIVALSASDAVQDLTEFVLGRALAIIEVHPTLGIVLFVLASALSAMLAFFSTIVVVPVAVAAWGAPATALLLWVSWLVGGCCSYAIGRTLGLRVTAWFVSRERVDHYAARLSARAGFWTIWLFQLALPSEVPGYVLGVLHYRFRVYLPALALAELPYAIGTVYLGQRFLEGRVVSLALVGLAGIVLITLAYRLLHRRLEHPRPSGRRELATTHGS
jgi:uncharacterized membrane protein YdjX (TVP38/TMEM64 family)